MNLTYKNKLYKGFVFSNLNLGANYFLLSIDIGKTTTNPIPGQFLNLYVGNYKSFILPRPFTIFDFSHNDEVGSTIHILYRVVGKGTEEISKLAKGDEIEFIYPLGNGFQIRGSKPLLIAGGSGIASLHYLANILQNDGIKFQFFVGVRNNSEYNSIKKVLDGFDLCWAVEEDTIKGIFHGNVVELYKAKSKIDYDEIFICGPTEMLKSFASIFDNSKRTSIYCSLEARMACGVGACLGCAIPTKSGYKLCCSDGPVFEMLDILWKHLP